MSSGPQKRTFFSRIAQLNMDTDEFVYILLELKSVGFGGSTVVNRATESACRSGWAVERSL